MNRLREAYLDWKLNKTRRKITRYESARQTFRKDLAEIPQPTQGIDCSYEVYLILMLQKVGDKLDKFRAKERELVGILRK